MKYDLTFKYLKATVGGEGTKQSDHQKLKSAVEMCT